VNSAALVKAGMTKETPDPPGGFIVRDADGNATGYIKEPSAMIPVIEACDCISAENIASSLERVLLGMASQGFTSIFDALSTFAMVPGLTAARIMDSAGKLPVRLEAAYTNLPGQRARDILPGLKVAAAGLGSPEIDVNRSKEAQAPCARR
jgi:predicted amidohydrolase YtcJ